MNLLSIAVLVYNSKDYIRNCLDSIVNQDFDNCELIIIDDGSTDGSSEIVDEYRNDLVKVIHKENEGIACSRRRGILEAEGEYVWIIDGDDALDKGALDSLRFFLSQERPDILRFNYKSIRDDKAGYAYDIYPSDLYEGNRLIPLRHHLVRNSYTKIFPHWVQIYRRELVKDIPLITEKEVFGDDIVFNCMAYQKAKSVKIVSDTLYCYYYRAGSFSRSSRPILNGMINSYLFLKQEYSKMGIFEEYRDDLLFTFIDYSLLNDGRNGWGGIVSEYARYEDQTSQRQMVKEIIASSRFQEIVQDSKGRKLSKELSDLYEILERKDEEALYHYLGHLSLRPKEKK